MRRVADLGPLRSDDEATDAFVADLLAAAVDVRAIAPLTDAEARVLGEPLDLEIATHHLGGAISLLVDAIETAPYATWSPAPPAADGTWRGELRLRWETHLRNG